MNNTNATVLGQSLRGQIYDLFRMAEKLDGQRPFLIVTSVGNPVIVWMENEPSVEQAEHFIREGEVVSVLPCDLRGIAGTVPPQPINGQS